jgi:hypothetical protein
MGVGVTPHPEWRTNLKKGDKFRIDWDKLINSTSDTQTKNYQSGQKKIYEDAIFTAAKVSRSRGLYVRDKYIISYFRDGSNDEHHIGLRFVIPV